MGRTWRAWQRSALLASEPLVRTVVVLPKSWRGGPSLWRLLRGLWQWPTSDCSGRSATNLAEAQYIRGVQRGKSMDSGGLPTCPSKQQWSAGGTPEGGQAKRPKQVGQLSYARVTQEGLRVAVVSENYPESQISKENFTDIQLVIGWLVDELPEEGVHPQTG